MKKVNFFSGVICTLAAILMGAMIFSSCQKEDFLDNVIHTKDHGLDSTVVVIGSHTHTITRDGMFGTITSYNSETHEDNYFTVPLGGVHFHIQPHDTIEGTPVVNHMSLNLSPASFSEFDTLECHITQTNKQFADSYNQYTLSGEIWWWDGWTVIWGDTLYFPNANGNLLYQNVTTSDEGTDGTWDYTLATTTYGLSFMGNVTNAYGYKSLKREAGSDELESVTKTNEGWQPLTYGSNGWPTSGKSWIELTYHYSMSGDVVERIEQVLNYSVSVPADTELVAQNFNVSWMNPSLGGVSTLGQNTNNNITVVNKRQTYTVGGSTPSFPRVFRFNWQTASWSDGTHTFSMPSPAFAGHSESHTLTALSAVTGYDRKLATNTVTANLNGISGSAPAKTTIKVANGGDDPDDPTDELVSRTIVNEGLTYVSPNINTSWITIREVWSVSGTREYNKQINLANSMVSPAIGPEIINDFGMVSTQGAGTTGSEQTVNTYTSGEFTVTVYRKTFMVNCGPFNLQWVGQYEKAVYTPMTHNMPSSAYTYAVSSGSYTSDLGQTLTQNTTYNRKVWTQNITATLNNHTAQHSGTAEVWVPDFIERTTPEWLGNPVDAKYTRVQSAVGANFIDMIVFKYENGVVMAPNGHVDLSLIYAFTQSDAVAHGVEKIGSANAWYSGVYYDGKWHPAKITPTGDYTSWTYIADANHQHAVTRANALILGIGYDYHPIPSAQSVTINGGVITISYSANNAGPTVTSTLQLR